MAAMRLIDSHAHLQASAFADDAAIVITAARLAGVERLLVPGWDVDSSKAGLRLALRHGVPTSAGIHPHVAAAADQAAWLSISRLAAREQVRAIGETGLDYDRAFSPRDAQLDNLRRHLELAFGSAKPLILHCRSAPGRRDAQDDLLAELGSAGVGGPDWRERFGGRPPGVLHSFSGPVDYAEQALSMGLAVSFSGLVFRRGEEASADVGRLVPPTLLLTETDSPYLSPPGTSRRRNEPANVALTTAWLAEARGADPVALGEALVTAFDLLFGGSLAP